MTNKTRTIRAANGIGPGATKGARAEATERAEKAARARKAAARRNRPC